MLCKICQMKQDGLVLVSVCSSRSLINSDRHFLIFYFLSVFFVSAGCSSAASWKLHYYQWVMRVFELYNLSEAACQFAITALEQVEEALGCTDGSVVADPHGESATALKGQLWANVFKFVLDLNYYYDAYCALISNPDEESKSTCLRRFIIVLYERGAMKVLFQLLF